MRSTTIVMIVAGILIVLLLITVIIQSTKKPGKFGTGSKKKSRSSSSNAVGTAGVSGLSTASTGNRWDPTIPNPIVTVSSYDSIPGVRSDGQPPVVVSIPGQGQMRVLEELGQDFSQYTNNCGVRRLECLQDPERGTEEICNNLPGCEWTPGTAPSQTESSSIAGTSSIESTTEPVLILDSVDEEYDDIPITSEIDSMKRTYTPNIGYMQRIYGNDDAVVIVPGDVIEIDLDDNGRQYIPHRVEDKFEDSYSIRYVLYPREGHRSSYSHHQPGYDNYYMVVEMILRGSQEDITSDSVLTNNYIIDPYGRSMIAKRYRIEDDKIILTYKIRSVEDFIPISTNIATFNNIEDRYLIPMVDNIMLTSSPYDYTDSIYVNRSGVPIMTEYDIINDTYAIRI